MLLEWFTWLKFLVYAPGPFLADGSHQDWSSWMARSGGCGEAFYGYLVWAVSVGCALRSLVGVIGGVMEWPLAFGSSFCWWRGPQSVDGEGALVSFRSSLAQ